MMNVSKNELQRILGIPLESIVVLAQKDVEFRDLLDLKPGTIVEFEKSIATPLELMVNNCRIGNGVAVKVGEKFGMKLTAIESVENTVKALGGPMA